MKRCAISHVLSGDNQARTLERENLVRRPPFFPARMTLGELARQEGHWEGSIAEHGMVLDYHLQNPFVLRYCIYMDAGKLALARQTLDRVRPVDRESCWTRAIDPLLLAKSKALLPFLL